MGELRRQKERLKGVQTKVLDILNMLGLSNYLMKSVERRDFADKIIVLGGIFLVLILLGIIYHFK